MGPPPCALAGHEIAPPPADFGPAVWLPMIPPLQVGLGGDWMMLAESGPILSFAELGMILVGIIALIGFYGKVSKMESSIVAKAATAVRAELGDKKEMNIGNQPLQVQGVVRFVAEHELEERLDGYVTAKALHDVETRIDGKLETNFRELDKKRSYSIGNLHEHLTGTTKALTDKIETAGSRQHDRTDALAQQVGVLIGEVRGLAAQSSEAVRIAQGAALEAAKAGRKS